MTFPPARLSAIGLCCLASTSALAGPGDCDLIAKSMLAVADRPGVRQTMTLPGGGEAMSSVLLKDAMHIRSAPSEPWRAMPINAAMRRTMAEKAMVSLPLSDCAAGGDETVGGVAARSYSYRQPNPLKPGEMTASRILIAPSDGLPRRMDLSDGSAMVFEYGDFKAPTP